MADAVQSEMFERGVRGELRTVPLDQITPDAAILLPGKTDAEFEASIRERGVVQPVVLVDRGVDNALGWRYDIGGGRRRVVAARLAGHTEIPAYVLEAGEMSTDELAIVENEQRNRNDVALLEHVERLIHEGRSEAEIRHLAGWDKREWAKYTALLALPLELRQAVYLGRMAVGVGREAAKLPPSRQEALCAILRAEGRVRGDDIKAVRSAVREATTASLDPALFALPATFEAGAARGEEPWQARAMRLISELKAVVPVDTDGERIIHSALHEAEQGVAAFTEVSPETEAQIRSTVAAEAAAVEGGREAPLPRAVEAVSVPLPEDPEGAPVEDLDAYNGAPIARPAKRLRMRVELQPFPEDAERLPLCPRCEERPQAGETIYKVNDVNTGFRTMLIHYPCLTREEKGAIKGGDETVSRR